MRLPTRFWVLGLVIAIVAVGGALLFARFRSQQPPAGAQAERTVRSAERTPSEPIPLTDLRLDRLRRGRRTLAQGERDLFRFKPKAPPAPPPPGAVRPQLGPPLPAALPFPPGPSPPPPIALKFIGLVDAPAQAGRLAVLSDARGNVFYGKEGDIIDGRYRVLKIGPESAEIAYTDGRGRQTLRLSGQ